MGRAARHHCNQHARRAHRGSRRHSTRPSHHDNAGTLAIRTLSARRKMGFRRRLSAHAQHVARQKARYSRAGPHRQGHRDAMRGVRSNNRLSHPHRAKRRALHLLSDAEGHGAGCRHSDERGTRRRRHPSHHQCGDPRSTRPDGRADQYWPWQRCGRAGPDQSATRQEDFFRRPRCV